MIYVPLKMDGWNTTFLLGRPIFNGYNSFRECRSFRAFCDFKYIFHTLRSPTGTSFAGKDHNQRHLRDPSGSVSDNGGGGEADVMFQYVVQGL